MAVDVEDNVPIAQRILQPQAPAAFNFAFNDFLKREYRFGLDPNRPICNAFKQGHCPLGNSCPDKHPTSSAYNNSFHGTLVCKHWLRGLCKKGDACEFLHEYNLRRMPECNHYSRHQVCSNGDDCLYLHIDPESKRPPCPHYERGFCPLGPRCANKHVRKDRICRFYIAGFCPNGRTCSEGAHPKWQEELKKPEVKVEKSAEELEREKAQREEEARREEEKDQQMYEMRGGQQGERGRFRGGWQGRKKRSGGRHRRGY